MIPLNLLWYAHSRIFWIILHLYNYINSEKGACIMTVKALLLADNNTTGSGLKSIRHTNAKMVDISAYASVLGTNLYFHIIV